MRALEGRTDEGRRVRFLIPNKLELGAQRLYLSYPTIEVLLREVSAISALSNNYVYLSLFNSSCATMVKQGQLVLR